jgi:hypothetical protein
VWTVHYIDTMRFRRYVLSKCRWMPSGRYSDSTGKFQSTQTTKRKKIESLSLGIRLLVDNRPLSHYPIDPSFSSHCPYMSIFNIGKNMMYLDIYMYIKLYVVHYTVQIYSRLDNSQICIYMYIYIPFLCLCYNCSPIIVDITSINRILFKFIRINKWSSM